MNLIGKCDFCGAEGKWEGAIYNAPPGAPGYDDPNNRPDGWAASYPVRPVPAGIAPMDWMSPENCERTKLEMLLQCPNCRGKFGIPRLPEMVDVAGVQFRHGYTDKHEYYAHRDARLRKWQVFRNLWGREGNDRDMRIWMAVLIQPGENGTAETLNSQVHDLESGTEKDILADVPSLDDPTPLLEAVAEMIKKG